MKKIFLILFLTTIIASAADTYIFWVDNPDMVKMYSLVFESMKRIFGANSYVDLLKLMFLFGGFFTLAAGVFKGFGNGMKDVLGGYFKYIATVVALLILVFSGSSTIMIKSKTLGSACSTSSPQVINTTVEDFPSILGASFSFISSLGTYMTDAVEKEYTTATADPSLSMRNGGYAHSLRDSLALLDIKLSADINSSDPTYKKNIETSLKQFLTQCIIVPYSGKGSDGEKEINKLSSSGNIYEYLEKLFITSPRNVGGIESDKYSLNINGNIMNCGAYFASIKPSLDEFKSKIGCGSQLGYDAASLIMGGSPDQSSFDEMAIQAGMVTALRDSYQNAGIGVSGVSYATGKSKSEMTQTNIANGQYMAKMLPMLQMTLRIILYAFFPFVFVIVILPSGLTVLGQYLKSILWIELWTPVAAVLNMFLNSFATSQNKDIYGGEGLTLMNSITMMSDTAIIAGMAGYLYLMVPGLTWAFISGSMMMLENLAHGLAAHMQKNIRTESINLDMSKRAKQKEASARAGKSLSMAEMQHYEAVQNGRIEGAKLGLEMKEGSDTIVDMEAAETQSEISSYERTTEITGISGEHQGEMKGYHEATKDITAVKIGSSKTKDEQDGETEADAMKDVGKARSKTKNVDDGTITITKEENNENADQADRNAKGNASAYSGKNKRERAATKSEIAETAKNDAQYNDNNHADAQGASEGEQNKRNTDSDRVQRNAENAAGIGPNQIGNSRAMTTGETIAAQNAFKQIMQNSGKWDNNKTDVENMRALKKEQAMFQTIMDVDKDGNMTETIRDKDGNLQHQVVSSKNIKEWENFFRRDMLEVLSNMSDGPEEEYGDGVQFIKGRTEEGLIEKELGHLSKDEVARTLDYMAEVNAMMGMVKGNYRALTKVLRMKDDHYRRQMKNAKMEMEMVKKKMKNNPSKEVLKQLEADLEKWQEQYNRAKKRQNTGMRNMYERIYQEKAEKKVEEAQKKLEEARASKNAIKEFEAKQELKNAKQHLADVNDKYYTRAGKFFSETVNPMFYAKNGVEYLKKGAHDLTIGKIKDKLSIFKNERDEILEMLQNDKLTGKERGILQYRVQTLEGRMRAVNTLKNVKDMNFIKEYKQQRGDYIGTADRFEGENRAVERINELVSEKERLMSNPNNIDQDAMDAIDNEIKEQKRFLMDNNSQYDRFLDKNKPVSRKDLKAMNAYQYNTAKGFESEFQKEFDGVMNRKEIHALAELASEMTKKGYIGGKQLLKLTPVQLMGTVGTYLVTTRTNIEETEAGGFMDAISATTDTLMTRAKYATLGALNNIERTYSMLGFNEDNYYTQEEWEANDRQYGKDYSVAVAQALEKQEKAWDRYDKQRSGEIKTEDFKKTHDIFAATDMEKKLFEFASKLDSKVVLTATESALKVGAAGVSGFFSSNGHGAERINSALEEAGDVSKEEMKVLMKDIRRSISESKNTEEVEITMI